MGRSILQLQTGSRQRARGSTIRAIAAAWRESGAVGTAGVTTAVLACVVVTLWWQPVTTRVLGTIAALLVLVAAALVDVVEHRLPNPIVAAALVPVVVTVALVGSSDVARGAVAGAALVGLPLFGTHLVTPAGMGFGDVKAGAALGAAVGLLDAATGAVRPRRRPRHRGRVGSGATRPVDPPRPVARRRGPRRPRRRSPPRPERPPLDMSRSRPRTHPSAAGVPPDLRSPCRDDRHRPRRDRALARVAAGAAAPRPGRAPHAARSGGARRPASSPAGSPPPGTATRRGSSPASSSSCSACSAGSCCSRRATSGPRCSSRRPTSGPEPPCRRPTCASSGSPLDAGVRSIPASEASGLVGRHPAGLVPAGTMLAPAMFTAGLPLGADEVVVGAALDPGEAPLTQLEVGASVELLDVTAAGLGAATEVTEVATSLGTGTVWAVEPVATGQLWVSVRVGRDVGLAVAVASAADRLRVVLWEVAGVTVVAVGSVAGSPGAHEPRARPGRRLDRPGPHARRRRGRSRRRATRRRARDRGRAGPDGAGARRALGGPQPAPTSSPGPRRPSVTGTSSPPRHRPSRPTRRSSTPPHRSPPCSRPTTDRCGSSTPVA